MLRQCWLINPKSGNGGGERLAAALRDKVRVEECDFSRLDNVLSTVEKGEKIVVAGGDGTSGAVLTSLALPDRPVAVLPLGTGNDLAREVGNIKLPCEKNPEKLPEIIEELKEVKLATWEIVVDGVKRGFTNYASLGYEGAVVRDFARWRSATNFQSTLVNRAMYGFFGCRNFVMYRSPARVGSDNSVEMLSVPMRGLVVSNIQSHLGMGKLSSQCDPSDDVIECISPSLPRDYLKMMASRFIPVPDLPVVQKGRSLTISDLTPGTQIQVDGEPHAPLKGTSVEIRFRGFVRILGKK
ncbi:MAG: diacylglycerol/lipid kinase family protein [Pseudomonadota bacterium]|jgi:diacylglycerol kinase family enzyme